MLTARVRAYVASVGGWVRSSVPEPVDVVGEAEVEADLARLVQARAAAEAGRAALEDVRRISASVEEASPEDDTL